MAGVGARQAARRMSSQTESAKSAACASLQIGLQYCVVRHRRPSTVTDLHSHSAKGTKPGECRTEQ
eukprot:6187603-Pleurochrysis_carterae.AAC.1